MAVTLTHPLEAAASGADSTARPKLQVSVVTPLFNERECVNLLVDSLARLEQSLSDRMEFEFLLVDDGSTDGTSAFVQDAIAGRANMRLIQHAANRGIAAAIHTGLRAARNEVVASIDCDGSYDPMLLGQMAPLLSEGVDLVTASPYHPLGEVEDVPAWRLQLSKCASRLYGLACRYELSCYTCCFRVYRRSAVAAIELNNERFVGVAELLCKVVERGGRVIEHPATLRSRVAGHSKMRVVRATLGHLQLIGAVAIRRVRTKAKPTHAASDGAPMLPAHPLA
jgi:dolichol-phosphate mannosyltransferase